MSRRPKPSPAIRRWCMHSTTRGGPSSATVEPNAAHRALARLDAEWPGELLLVTQNVDDLHERAGSKRLLHMHGELTSGWCLACDERFWLGRPDGRGRRACPDAARRQPGACPSRHRLVRRDAVRDGADRRGAASAATCSSRSGRRARSIPPRASSRPRAIAARRRSRSTWSRALAAIMFDESRTGRAGELVPAWVEEMLSAA